MKDRYIRQVSAMISASKEKKQYILRDLNEIFDSAISNGETEQQVIERLGTPENFIKELETNSGMKMKQKKSMVLPVIFFVIAAILVGVYLTAYFLQERAENIIGQAYTVTTIKLEASGENWVLLALGAASLFVAVIIALRYFWLRRRKK
jgi:uncharacterized membrane protein